MSRHYFIYANNIFYSAGVRSMVADFATGEETVFFSRLEEFSQLIDVLSQPVEEDDWRWILCDIDSLPEERLHALQVIKEHYREHHQQLVIVLGKNNIALFFALHAIFPQASWLLKNESLDDLLRFIESSDCHDEEKIFFSHSLVNYTRQAWRGKKLNNSISGDDWWLMEEILKGKSLSKISSEQQIDVRRLSRCKRELMKKLNAKNNVELFNIFKCIIETPCD